MLEWGYLVIFKHLWCMKVFEACAEPTSIVPKTNLMRIFAFFATIFERRMAPLVFALIYSVHGQQPLLEQQVSRKMLSDAHFVQFLANFSEFSE